MSDKRIIRLSASPEGFGQTPDELEPEMFVSELPIQHSHEVYEDDELGLYVGVWDTTDMVETAGPYSCDEFMWLLEGEAAIKNSKTGAVETVRAGEPFVIPRGYDCQWCQKGYLRKFFVISENPSEDLPETAAYEGIIIPLADAPLESLSTEPAFLGKGGDGVQREHICYRDNRGRFLAGTWSSEPFESEERPFPYNEFAYVQAGAINLIDVDGEEHRFSAGDAFFVPQGVICRARVSEPVRLFFAIVRQVN